LIRIVFCLLVRVGLGFQAKIIELRLGLQSRLVSGVGVEVRVIRVSVGIMINAMIRVTYAVSGTHCVRVT
jgi:hypothetical protein